MGYRSVGRVTALAGLLALTGCWPQVGFGSEHQRWNSLEDQLTVDNVATLEESWSTSFDQLASEIIVQGGQVFLTHAADGAVVRAVNATTGTTSWERRIDPAGNAWGWPSDAVMVGDDLMATWSGPDCTGGEVRLDPSTGAINEDVETTPAERGTPVPFGDRFAQFEVVTPEGTCDAPPIPPTGRPTDIVVRDVESGAIQWRADLTQGDRLPAVGGGHLVVGYAYYAGYDIDGCGRAVCPPRWQTYDGNAGSPPVIVGDHMYASRPGKVIAVDTATGATSWEGPTGTTAGYLIYADGVIYSSAGGTLFAFDPDGCGAPSCAPLWSAPLPAWTEFSGWSIRAAAGGVLYVVGADVSLNLTDGIGRVIGLDPTRCAAGDCDPVWDSGELVGRPESVSVDEGKLFVELHRDQTALPDQVIAYAPAG